MTGIDWEFVKKGCPNCGNKLQYHSLTWWCLHCGAGRNWKQEKAPNNPFADFLKKVNDGLLRIKEATKASPEPPQTPLLDNSKIHIETHKGVVVAVWFHCLNIPFQQIEIDQSRLDSLEGAINPDSAIDDIRVREALRWKSDDGR